MHGTLLARCPNPVENLGYILQSRYTKLTGSSRTMVYHMITSPLASMYICAAIILGFCVVFIFFGPLLLSFHRF